MKVLIAIDGSECSCRAIDYVLRRPWQSRDQFRIVTVLESPPVQLSDDESLEDYIVNMNAACSLITDSARKRLQYKLPKNRVTTKVLSGIAQEQICQHASEWSADLIILGTHGHQDCRRFIDGSVAESVTRHAPCSVEIVKEKAECMVHR